MKVLAIRQPWASLIAEGYKTIEVRTQNTRIREEILIYASRTNPKECDLETAKKYISCVSLPKGVLLATARLADSIILKDEDFQNYFEKHKLSNQTNKFGHYGWILEDVKKIEPLPFKMPRGAVIWSKIETGN
ncbi:ASCH domain-containing protein [Methanococcoides orientis]|uniref:ASCH domain-containing protein n=1 Tax=Methanococcoides orientis TaxID=2822137 RepID=UPI001E4E3073|nr:ASCH domain-containing protein [Methanococcoides orientis]UGV39969.1 ASCH domain-containing protein [Methanococcoides orientis]